MALLSSDFACPLMAGHCINETRRRVPPPPYRAEEGKTFFICWITLPADLKNRDLQKQNKTKQNKTKKKKRLRDKLEKDFQI